jgi:hypothetical protein
LSLYGLTPCTVENYIFHDNYIEFSSGFQEANGNPPERWVDRLGFVIETELF